VADIDNLEELIRALGNDRLDGEVYVFKQASYQLWKLGDMVVDSLATILHDGPEKTCIRVAYLLGNIGTDRAKAALTQALEDEASSLRRLPTVDYKIWQDDQIARDFYLKLFSRPIEWTLTEANEEVTDEIVKTLIESMNISELPRDEVYTLAKIGDERVIEPLIRSLAIEDDKVFQAAFQGLLKIGKAAVEPLIAHLKDENSQMRLSVAWLLGAIGDAQAVAPLIDALSDQDMSVRVTAISALGDLSDSRAIEPLSRFLNDDDEWTRRAVIISLGQIGEQDTTDIIVSALDDSSQVVQLGSAQVLAELADERARDKLEELLATTWRQEAQNALRRLAREPNAPSIFDKEYDE